MMTARGTWLDAYRATHKEELDRDPELARWLMEEYRPLAGGWHY